MNEIQISFKHKCARHIEINTEIKWKKPVTQFRVENWGNANASIYRGTLGSPILHPNLNQCGKRNSGVISGVIVVV